MEEHADGSSGRVSDSVPLVVSTEYDMFPSAPIVRDVVVAAGFRHEAIPMGMERLVVERAPEIAAIVVLGFRVDAAFIDLLERCKVVARLGSGLDTVDVERARERGITVTYVPYAATKGVAEHALALILACERRIAFADRSIRSGRWPAYTELAPMRRLRGLTLGIVGLGRIGRALAELASGLGLRVIAHDPYMTSDPGLTGVALVPLLELLPQADILSLNLPLSLETRGWLDAAKLALLPTGATVVNTTRGGVVDEKALLEALDSGSVRAAGLDVFEGEPDHINRDLIAHPNVVSTGHSAAFSEEFFDELFRTAAEDVVHVLRDEPPVFPVPTSAPEGAGAGA